MISHSGLTDAGLLLLVREEHSALASERVGLRRPRLSHPSLGATDGLQEARQATVLRLVSTVEAYTDAVGSELLWESVGGASGLVEYLAREAEVASAMSWDARVTHLRRHFGVNVKASTSWEQFEASTHARNAVAHGLGSLTAAQRRSTSVVPKLRKVGIVVSGGRLVLDEDCVGKVASACRSLVSHIDQQLAARSSFAP